ncbi:unnamed protein product [Caenorhabditis brenneri]
MSQLTAFESVSNSELSALVFNRLKTLEQSNAILAADNGRLQQEKKAMSEKLEKRRNLIQRQKEDNEKMKSQLKFEQELYKKSQFTENRYQEEIKDLEVKLELAKLNLSVKTDEFDNLHEKLRRPGGHMKYYTTELADTARLLNKEKQNVSDLKKQIEEEQERAIKINTTLFMTRMEKNQEIEELKTQIDKLKKENEDLKTQFASTPAVLVQPPQLPATSPTRKQAERKRAATVAVRGPYPKRGRPTKEESERRRAEAEKQAQTALAEPSVAKRGPGRPKKEKKE